MSFDPTGLVFSVTLCVPGALPYVNLYDVRKFDKVRSGSHEDVLTEQEPFATAALEDSIVQMEAYPPRIPVITSSATSNDGALLLLGTSSGVHYVLNAMDCSIVARLVGHDGLERLGAPPTAENAPRAGASGSEVSWTSDGRFVIGGSLDGKICMWDVAPPAGSVEASALDRPAPGPMCTLAPFKTFPGHGGKPSRVVAFNPRYSMLATGGLDLVRRISRRHADLAQGFWIPAA